jgi:hypothetical protein
MKATRWGLVSKLLLAAGCVFLFLTLVLPLVKLPEVQTYSHPPNTKSNGPDIEGVGIPTVNGGTKVTVSVSGFKPGSLEIDLIPVVGSQFLAALFAGNAGSGPVFGFTVTANGTYSLELLVIAFNGTGYTMQYGATWSPFDPLRVYTAPVVLLIAFSAAGVYYFRIAAKREFEEDRVMREVRDREKAVRSSVASP